MTSFIKIKSKIFHITILDMAVSFKELLRVDLLKTVYINYKYLQLGGGENFTYICIQQHPVIVM